MVAVSYNNLWKLLIDKGMNKTELKEASGVSFNVMARMGKNKTVSLESLEKICMVLNCNIGDIMDITTKKRGYSLPLSFLQVQAVLLSVLRKLVLKHLVLLKWIKMRQIRSVGTDLSGELSMMILPISPALICKITSV